MNETDYVWDFAQRLRMLGDPELGGPDGDVSLPPSGRSLGRRLAETLEEIGQAERHFAHFGAPECREPARWRFRLLGLKLRDIAPLSVVCQTPDADIRMGGIMADQVETVAREMAGAFEELAAMFPTEMPAEPETPPASGFGTIPFSVSEAQVAVLGDGLRIARKDEAGAKGLSIDIPVPPASNRLLWFLSAWAREDRKTFAREHRRLRIHRKNYTRLSEEIERMKWDYFRRTLSAANRLVTFTDKTKLLTRLRTDGGPYIAACAWDEPDDTASLSSHRIP